MAKRSTAMLSLLMSMPALDFVGLGMPHRATRTLGLLDIVDVFDLSKNLALFVPDR